MRAGIKEICGAVLRHGSLDTQEQMVEYNYEPVQGDQVTRGEAVTNRRVQNHETLRAIMSSCKESLFPKKSLSYGWWVDGPKDFSV